MAWSKDGWEPTPFLRYVANSPYEKVQPLKMQQLWVKEESLYWHSLEPRATEWRDIPIEEAS